MVGYSPVILLYLNKQFEGVYLRGDIIVDESVERDREDRRFTTLLLSNCKLQVVVHLLSVVKFSLLLCNVIVC